MEGDDDEENKPQLIVIEANDDDYNEISTDYLCFTDYQLHNVQDLHLEYLLEDKHYFIVSPQAECPDGVAIL